MQVWFAEKPIHNYRDAERYADRELFRLWWEGMLERGVLFHPSPYENLFLSTAHSREDVAVTLAAAREVAAALARGLTRSRRASL
jgi:glutamate-1-semialdehyde 2,1-aminomutase